MGESFGVDYTAFPDEMAINNEKIKLTTHTGTHLDAPYHFGIRCNGSKAKRIHEIPLEWCFSKGKLLDLSEKEDSTPISKHELEKYIIEHNITIEVGDIVLIATGASKYWNTNEYFTRYRGIMSEGVKYILSFGVKIIGIDSFGFDEPFHNMLEKFLLTGNNKDLWPAHILGRQKEYCHIERLNNLNELAGYKEFYVACFPIKMKTGASWVRAVAIVDEGKSDNKQGN